MNGLSKLGAVFASLYAVFTAPVFLYAANCSTSFCVVGAWVAVLPWFPLFGESSSLISGWPLLIILAVLDTVIIYFLFSFIEKLFRRSKS